MLKWLKHAQTYLSKHIKTFKNIHKPQLTNDSANNSSICDQLALESPPILLGPYTPTCEIPGDHTPSSLAPMQHNATEARKHIKECCVHSPWSTSTHEVKSHELALLAADARSLDDFKYNARSIQEGRKLHITRSFWSCFL